MVGVDLRNLSGGAITFARWLSDLGPQHRFLGVHVVEYVPHLLMENQGAGTPEQIQAVADEALAPLHGDAHFDELGAVLATAAEDGLVAAVHEKRADALIVGRRAPRAGEGIIRLGRVARRLLRTLPCPVVVVPPDVDAAHIGTGPVVVATCLTDNAVAAVRWSAKLAESLRRPLVLVHAMQAPDQLAIVVPSVVWEGVVSQRTDWGRAELDAWVHAHGFEHIERVAVEGPPTHVLGRFASERDACLLVMGSRRLGTFDRLFQSSVGSEIAGSSPVPVAVVPPRADDPP
jgi:nucleotide-binding universal stress UspA family protein